MSQPVPGWESTPAIPDPFAELLEPAAKLPLERQQLDLRRMEQNVERYDVPQVALANLPELHIRALPVNLDPAGAPCTDLSFFVPYQGPLPRFDDDRPWPICRVPDMFEHPYPIIRDAETLWLLFGRYLATCSINITQGVGGWVYAE